MSSKITIVKGIRASQEFFDKCDLVAKAEGVDRNKLIVRVVSEYYESKVKDLGFIEIISMTEALNIEMEQLIKADLEEKVEND